jgi:hypothetical protein
MIACLTRVYKDSLLHRLAALEWNVLHECRIELATQTSRCIKLRGANRGTSGAHVMHVLEHYTPALKESTLDACSDSALPTLGSCQ